MIRLPRQPASQGPATAPIGAGRGRVVRGGLVVLGLSVLAACAPSALEQGAVSRGDQAWAAGEPLEALAEYRLAYQGGDRSEPTLMRVAHAYAELGRVDDALGSYAEAVNSNPDLADQAATDMIRLARRAEARGDRFGMATAIGAASQFQPGVTAPDMALPLARHYSENGEHDRALPHYEQALASVVPDSAPDLVYETALAYEELGDCSTGLVYFEQYRELIPRWRRGEVNWHVGNCSYLLAADLWTQVPDTARGQDSEDEQEVLRLLETTINLREPRNRLASAFYQKGEILSLRGECDAAVAAFRQVLLEDPSGNSPLVMRARQRIDEIRFGPRPEARRNYNRAPSPENTQPRGCG